MVTPKSNATIWSLPNSLLVTGACFFCVVAFRSGHSQCCNLRTPLPSSRRPLCLNPRRSSSSAPTHGGTAPMCAHGTHDLFVWLIFEKSKAGSQRRWAEPGCQLEAADAEEERPQRRGGGAAGTEAAGSGGGPERAGRGVHPLQRKAEGRRGDKRKRERERERGTAAFAAMLLGLHPSVSSLCAVPPPPLFLRVLVSLSSRFRSTMPAMGA